MSLAIGSVLSANQASYVSRLYRGIDRNYDNAYSKQEVQKFADSYQESTGSALDVDAVFEKYDTDQDGMFSNTEYKAVMENDALGMEALLGAETEQESAVQAEDTGSDMSSWLSSLSGRAKNSLVRATFQAETTGNLLTTMFGSGGFFANMNNVISQYNTAKMYNSAQVLSTFQSTFSIYM